MVQSVCVFCGSRTGLGTIYRDAARTLGTALARRGLRLVYGGGKEGLMGVVADAALAAGAEVVGVMPDFLVSREVAHAGLAELYVVDSLHARKELMADLSDAFLTLPGGYGTLDELFEVLTWSQVGLHHKPHGLLNVSSYYTPLLQFIDQSVREGFLSAALRALLLDHDDPECLLDQLAAQQRIEGTVDRAQAARV